MMYPGWSSNVINLLGVLDNAKLLRDERLRCGTMALIESRNTENASPDARRKSNECTFLPRRGPLRPMNVFFWPRVP